MHAFIHDAFKLRTRPKIKGYHLCSIYNAEVGSDKI